MVKLNVANGIEMFRILLFLFLIRNDLLLFLERSFEFECDIKFHGYIVRALQFRMVLYRYLYMIKRKSSHVNNLCIFSTIVEKTITLRSQHHVKSFNLSDSKFRSKTPGSLPAHSGTV